MVQQLQWHCFLGLVDLSLITHPVSNANGKANATNLIKYSSMGCILVGAGAESLGRNIFSFESR